MRAASFVDERHLSPASLATPLHRYVSAMERLIKVVQDLSQTRSAEEVVAIVRIAARELTGADGATFVLRDGDQCYYVEENAISPLWKGKRFPIHACISGWAMLHGESTVIEDIYKDSRIPHDAYRPTFVKSLAMVPIRKNNPIGAIGNYWAANRNPSAEEIHILQALADTTSVALENAQLYTDLKRNLFVIQEREARIRDQHETLKVFTRALAHDLKEPAHVVNSFADVIEEEGGISVDAKEYFSHIRSAGKRMLALIEAVSAYMQADASKEAPNKENIDMNDALKEATDSVSEIINDKKALVSSDPLPNVCANRSFIVRLWRNLIVNAVRYNDRVPEVRISAEEQEGIWVFRVEDNGVGVEEKCRAEIFLPFKRASSQSDGAGLGLATCDKILAAHGGKIWYESTPGKGSTFFFSIPQYAFSA
ncbi:MAG: ATP-binding protein [Rickettsiales bacterium]